MIKRGKKYCKLSELKVNIGETKLLLNQKITKILNVKTYNLLNYKTHIPHFILYYERLQDNIYLIK